MHALVVGYVNSRAVAYSLPTKNEKEKLKSIFYVLPRYVHCLLGEYENNFQWAYRTCVRIREK